MKDGGKFEKIMKNSEREVELEKVEHRLTGNFVLKIRNKLESGFRQLPPGPSVLVLRVI